METYNANKHHMRVKLIFNPGSGANSESPMQLMNVIKELQAWKFIPETYLIQKGCDVPNMVQDAITQGIRMFVVCGGDGTVSTIAKTLIGIDATIGIIPTGTQNNIALSLGIPTDIHEAIAILRTGRSSKIDIGNIICDGIITPFIEVCSVGLFSSLFPSGDGIQHGDITRIGDFLATLNASPPSEIHLLIDNNQEIKKLGHVVLISNMPYVGRNYQVGALDSFDDGMLDVLFFADLTKLDLIGYVLKGPGIDPLEDPRIQHFRVRKIEIKTTPAMPIMADGMPLGEGSLQIEAQRHALSVMVKSETLNVLNKAGEVSEK